jgi:superfamily II DNA/RNA helicase
MVVYGGANVKFQASQLERGVHVLIATPGKLILFNRNHQLFGQCFQPYLIVIYLMAGLIGIKI